MNFPSIRLEGTIFTADLLDAIARDDKHSQRPADFGFDPTVKVKDEIAATWATSKALWTSYQAKISKLRHGETGTTETRNLFVLPLLSLLNYQPEKSELETINGKSYAISHRDTSRDKMPLHIVGWNDSLDKKRETGGPRMSPHALVQEYLNLTEHLYAIVTNGGQLRILRDSSRLIKLSFLEFDLSRIFEEDLFADFALLFRLLHASRLPISRDDNAESFIERYHQDSLDSGSRIRKGLAIAVESCIKKLANGFLSHPDNEELRNAASEDIFPITSQEVETSFSKPFYQALLRLIYRILFLLVTEERGLIHPKSTALRKIQIYRDYYSLTRIRLLSDSVQNRNPRYTDAWQSLLRCFELFAPGVKGKVLDIAPLGGLFDTLLLGALNRATLDNKTLLEALRELSIFQHPDTKAWIRINYAALNVEEFGSVYEGLLEYDPAITEIEPDKWLFTFVEGESRSSSGSHYTPDELVQPLIKHSLDHLIADKLKESNPEQALLSLTVCDITCGSGHILLNAARRIATELSIVRTGADQPDPSSMREATRDVIKNCIYGVDLNPLAVELCKVALWLEAHIPGEPLGFLDHHIRCGNAIVGFVNHDDLEKGVPDEAFKTLLEDDKEVAAAFRNKNKVERKNDKKQTSLNLNSDLQSQVVEVSKQWSELASLPERTPDEISIKRTRFRDFTNGKSAWLLKQIAAIPIAQFYLPKIQVNKPLLITDEQFREYLNGAHQPQGQATAAAWSIANRKKFFHWFLEFPQIMQKGGFDCILGNPPYLGGQALSGTYGYEFCQYVRWAYAPTGLSELVVFFLKRIHSLIRPNGFLSIITTNSIKDGDVRKDGLEQIFSSGSDINFAIRGIRWPGEANLVVSLLSIHKGKWNGPKSLDGNSVKLISPFFEDEISLGDPRELSENSDAIFQGSIFLGDGFLLTHEKAAELVTLDPKNRDVIVPLTNGREVNNIPNQEPGRSIINFFDWPIEKAKKYDVPFSIVEETVQPIRKENNREVYRRKWWNYAEPRPKLLKNLKSISHCFVAAATTKYLNFSEAAIDRVFANTIYVFTTDRWDHYGCVQSTIHEVWARKYSGALKQDLRYSPSDCFRTFAFPKGIWTTENANLASIGKRYHEHRKQTMLQLWIGLTDISNLLNIRDLTIEHIEKVSKKPKEEAEKGFRSILRLRLLLQELNQTILSAYGWTDLDLRHDFYDVDYLPENDRTRFTIHPDARKELLKRLLILNHQRHAQEAAAGLHDKKKPTKKGATKKAKVSETIPFELPPKFDESFLELPNTARTILSEEVWWTQFLAQFIALGDDFASLPNLEEAWQVMVQNKQFKPLLNEQYGSNTEAWLKSLPKDVPNEGFIPYLVDLYDDGKRFQVEKDTWRLSLPDNSMLKDYQGDDWVRTDVKVAIGVLKSKAYKPILEESPLVSAFKLHLAAM